MAASERRSSARVAPRSVTRVDATHEALQLSFQKDSPVDRSKVIALVQRRRNLRLAGPDLVRVSVFNPLIGTESWDNYQASIDVDDLRENYVSSNRSAYVHEHFSQVELEELRKLLPQAVRVWLRGRPAQRQAG